VSAEQTKDPSHLDSAQGGLRPLFADELRIRVASGVRLVRFEFCFSFLLFTVRRQSPVYLTESWQSRYLRGLGYSLLAILLGPWGVPWGLIYTPWAIWVNLTGGVDETDAVLARLEDRIPSTCALGSPPPANKGSGTA
jgi:hypothetical protein